MLRASSLGVRLLGRSLPGNTHAVFPVKVNLVAGEKLVDLLQGQEASLGVEEVDHGDEAEVEDAEIHVCLPANAINRDGSYLYNQEGKNPVGSGCERGGASADGQGGIFGGYWAGC